MTRGNESVGSGKMMEWQAPPNNGGPKLKWWQRLTFVPQLAGGLALIAFVGVLLVVPFIKEVGDQPLSTWQTLYAIAMGLLGSSLFLLYKLAGAVKEQQYEEREVGKNVAGLFVGPIAGWLSYFFVTAGGKGKPTLIWLPFVAGFSADLMVGIIYQGVSAVKFTLGIEPMEGKGTAKKGATPGQKEETNPESSSRSSPRSSAATGSPSATTSVSDAHDYA